MLFRSTKRKLNNLGIHTIGELANTDLNILKVHLKKHGELIYAFANGIDVSIVSNDDGPNKGYGNSTTITFDVEDPGIAKMILLSLAEKVCSRLRADNVMAGVVAVSIVDFKFNHISHQRTLLTSTNITNEIHYIACQLFDEQWDGAPIRNLGIHTSRIVSQASSRQLNLFDMTRYNQYAKLDKAVDIVRERYGDDYIKRAVFVNNPIYHMAGGISPDKRKPNYEERT